ncbi:monofunctional biosynthetic peptidoglycan transglycosylase [Methylonatrum kenyense]|uniref:monofunctional biosynthetic peptidoglycan transglycosylase n=1 Tax=Methylonatrum kenyense TaxID=455253 RepID=UPI0020BE63E4|nr:monofunctional biosynthetic peptidoglycan transglycosylase [Methylonatrum kenyense]MCK8517070.1 monofunctional biosynthetic peptidoglycan transglycosylase [Methylonatrum kenyense]
MKKRAGKRKLLPRILRQVALVLGGTLLLLATLSVLLVLLFRVVNPPTTAFMLQHSWQAWGNEELAAPRREWIDWDDISPHMRLAVVAAEDQLFPHHRGFDFDSIAAAVADYRDGGRLRGASTISQQVAKNLFLSPRRSLVRKGVEAWFTVLIEQFWGKRRILEVYLNVARFGPEVYGVEAASQQYFNKPAAQLQPAEAALLAAVLPSPNRFRVDAPSDHVRSRQIWIQRQMQSLGGTAYLGAL